MQELWDAEGVQALLYDIRSGPISICNSSLAVCAASRDRGALIRLPKTECTIIWLFPTVSLKCSTMIVS